MVVVLVFGGVLEDKKKYVIPPADQLDHHSAIVRSKASYKYYCYL